MTSSTATLIIGLGVGSGARVVGGNGTLAASLMSVAGDAVWGLGEGLDSSVAAGDTWMAAYTAVALISLGGEGSRGLGMPSSCSSGTDLPFGQVPLDFFTSALPFYSGYRGAPIETEGVGLLGPLAPASGSLTGDTIPASFFDCSMAIRSCSYSVNSITFFAADLGGFMRDFTNSYCSAFS